eukprot:TRINITY_DN6033_c0_g1_i1.p1 TRINITY_DN6033_c0_g1~~TRINITY_DN6033_c0_g1_i1.p1  ORF type:complete len:321 (-),score=1.25 TRINITY_DN6033_c0_g1_i1:611-1573(-)
MFFCVVVNFYHRVEAMTLNFCLLIIAILCIKHASGMECVDVPLPQTSLDACRMVAKFNLCNVSVIYGTYCNKTCGLCDDIDQEIEDCINPSMIECDITALTKFRDSLTAGENILSNWRGKNVCFWSYITCYKVDGKHDRVTDVLLDFWNTDEEDKMSGVLVPEFSKLRYINTFKITTQKGIKGTMYKEYSVWQDLKSFWIGLTRVSGTFPPEYSVWTNMQVFGFQYNDLSGQLPVQYSTWTKTEWFDVHWNQLAGTIPAQYSVMSLMQIFKVSRNDLKGTLPVQFSTMTRLEEFRSFGNSLSTAIPREWSTWPNNSKIQI